MKMLFGMALGALATWLYTSERARNEVKRRLASAPESFQNFQHTAASAAASGAQRVVEAVDSAPVPDRVKDAASGATLSMAEAAAKLKLTDADSAQASTTSTDPDPASKKPTHTTQSTARDAQADTASEPTEATAKDAADKNKASEPTPKP